MHVKKVMRGDLSVYTFSITGADFVFANIFVNINQLTKFLNKDNS